MSADGAPIGGGNPTAGPDPLATGESAAGTTRAAAALAYRPGVPAEPPQPEPAQASPSDPQRRDYLPQVIHDTLRPLTARVGLTWIATLFFLACFAPFVANSHPFLIKIDGRWSSPMLRHLAPIDVALPVAFVTAAVLVLRKPLTVGRGLAMVLWAFFLTYAFASWRTLPNTWEELRGHRGDELSFPAAAAVMGMGASVVIAGIVLPPLFALPRRATVRGVSLLAPLLLILVVFPIRVSQNVVFEQWRLLEKEGKVQAVVRAPIPFGPTDRQRDVNPKPGENVRRPQLQEPSRHHLAGTDPDGADLLSRMIHASRIALAIGFIATGIEVTIGVIVGGLMGYFAGWVDLLGMRLIEILESIPILVLLIAVTAAWGRNLYGMMVIIGLLRWTSDARFIRAEFLRLRKLDFVQAAIATGLPLRSILFRHMLPNGISPVLVGASFGVASAILLESTLSFLGLGLIDEPSWGGMLNQARSGAGFNWWIATYPGLLIFLTVFSYNLVGEAIRDALDPKLLKRE
jgi:peptide/nickel transport system permease protein